MTRARDIADQQDNSGGAVAPFVAGKNAVINGGFDIWQRGTSTTSAGYLADRWYNGFSSGSGTFAQETSVIPTGSRYALKFTASATAQTYHLQVIETANTLQFVGKTVTISSQVAASTSTPMQFFLQYSTTVDAGALTAWTTLVIGTATPTSTTYVPITATTTVPSNAQSLRILFQPTSTIANGVSIYMGQVQLEIGSSATPFSRAGGTIQGELAACQRYYWRWTAGGVYRFTGAGAAYTTTQASIYISYPVTMRTGATALDTSGMTCHLLKNDSYNSTGSFSLANQQESNTQVIYTHGSAIFAAGDFVNLSNAGTSTGYIGFTAEL